MRKGEATRERILSIAETAVLEKGFGATSIDEIIAAAGITKSGFFYHFADKNELAIALLERSMRLDDAVLDDIFGRAGELTDDPLHTFLVGLRLFAEMMADLPQIHPGCLVATYCYQDRLFDQRVHALNRAIVLGWRSRFHGMLAAVTERYPPREEVDLEALADMVSTVVEGGMVLSRATRDPSLLPTQILLLRQYMKLLFQPDSVPA